MIKLISEYSIIGDKIVKIDNQIKEEETSTEYEKAAATYVLFLLKSVSLPINEKVDTSSILSQIGKNEKI